MAVEIRAIAPDEFEKMRTTMGVVFGFDPPDGDRRFLELLPLDRTRCAFDDDQLVGTAGAFSLNMTVPGGEVPCGGTTIVAVAPTHRRQGILRAMMRSHLDDVKERGEPIAGLWASDSAIYGRFGYGCASVCYDVEIDVEHGEWSRLAPEPDRVRLVERAEAMTLAPPLYDRIRAEVPGFFERTTAWWEDRSFRDSESARGEAPRFGTPSSMTMGGSQVWRPSAPGRAGRRVTGSARWWSRICLPALPERGPVSGR